MADTQHLSDEAVAAFADGVLSGRARERALRHVDACAECNRAVAVQREAMWALRAAPAPALPGGLLDRLRGLPESTPIRALPTVIAPDGSTMLSVLGAPMAALVPEPDHHTHRLARARPMLGAAAMLTAFGVFAAGSSGQVVVGHASTPGGSNPAPVQPATGHGVAPALFVGLQSHDR